MIMATYNQTFKTIASMAVVSSVLVLGAGTTANAQPDDVSRSLRIAYNRMTPQEITAPAGTVVRLGVNVVSLADVTVSIPTAGVEPTRIRTGKVNPNIRGGQRDIMVGPLTPGRYEIRSGSDVIGTLVILGATNEVARDGAL